METGRGAGRRELRAERVAGGGLEDRLLAGEFAEGVAESGGAHVASGAELAEREWHAGLGEDVADPITRRVGDGAGVSRGGGRRRRADDECERGAVGVEVQWQAFGRASGAVLDGEGELLALAGEVEVRVAPVMLSPPLCGVQWRSGAAGRAMRRRTAHNGRE